MSCSFKDLEHLMDTVNSLGLSGLDCIIYQRHKQIFRYASGCSEIETHAPMAPDALYNIYSATKPITCAAALQLVERGQLSFTDPLYEYLPEYREMYVKYGTFAISPAKRPIRIVDLFTMCAGLSYDLDTPHLRQLIAETGRDFGTRDFVRALAREPLLFEPGQGWNYSYCHDVLGAVIETVSSMTFGAYLKRNIFDPLGMKDTGFSVPPEKLSRLAPQYEYDGGTKSVRRVGSACIGAAGLRHQSGGGGLISTVEDYILFADAMACGGVGASGERILAENTINLMRRNQLQGPCLADYRNMVIAEGLGYGLGVGTITDSAAAYRLMPEGSFYWGGLGGVQNFIDPSNELSYFVAQHTLNSPKERIEPKMLNIVYSSI